MAIQHTGTLNKEHLSAKETLAIPIQVSAFKVTILCLQISIGHVSEDTHVFYVMHFSYLGR